MDKSSLETLADGLKNQQAATARAVDQLKQELSAANLAALGKEKAADAVRAVTLEPSGRPKPWVMIVASVAFALLVTGITLRVVRGKR
jgi:hypothetical protein